jgi:hypothetical protein
MQYAAIEELERRFAKKGWAVAVRQLLTTDALRWWLEKRGQAPGRLVVVEFQQEWYHPAVSPGQARSVLRQIIVRPAAWLGCNEALLRYAVADARFTDYREVFDAVEFCNDAESYLASVRPGDWPPPDDWADYRWPAPHDGDGYWSKCDDSYDLLAMTLPSAGERKARLLACALARQLPCAEERRNACAIEAAECYAERRSSRRTMKSYCKHSGLPWLAEADTADVVRHAITALSKVDRKATRIVCDAVRETFANPLRPVELRHEWLRNNGGAAGLLAEAIDKEGRYEEMPVLADALEDAGCRASAVLEHCRSGATHRRGCWVMDLLRGR